MRVSRTIGLCGLALVGIAVLLGGRDSADAQVKNVSARQRHFDNAMKQLREALKSIQEAGVKEAKQKTLEPVVIQNLTAAAKYTNLAFEYVAAAKAADNPGIKK